MAEYTLPGPPEEDLFALFGVSWAIVLSNRIDPAWLGSVVSFVADGRSGKMGCLCGLAARGNRIDVEVRQPLVYTVPPSRGGSLLLSLQFCKRFLSTQVKTAN